MILLLFTWYPGYSQDVMMCPKTEQVFCWKMYLWLKAQIIIIIIINEMIPMNEISSNSFCI